MQDNKKLYSVLSNELDNASDDLKKCFMMCGELDDFFNMPNATKENIMWIIYEHKRSSLYYQIMLDYIVSVRRIVEKITKEIEVLNLNKEE